MPLSHTGFRGVLDPIHTRSDRVCVLCRLRRLSVEVNHASAPSLRAPSLRAPSLRGVGSSKVTFAPDETVILLTPPLHSYWYTWERWRGLQQNDGLVNG